MPDTFTLTHTVVASTKQEAEKLAIAELSGRYDNLQIDSTESVRSYTVSVLGWNNPVHDKVGNPISKGDKVLFGAAENVRVGKVDYVGKNFLNIVAEDTGWPNERRPDSVIVLPANLDTKAVTVDKLVLSTA